MRVKDFVKGSTAYREAIDELNGVWRDYYTADQRKNFLETGSIIGDPQPGDPPSGKPGLPGDPSTDDPNIPSPEIPKDEPGGGTNVPGREVSAWNVREPVGRFVGSPRDYKHLMTPLTFRKTLFNQYGKSVLIALVVVASFTLIWKWSQDDLEPDEKEFFELKRKQRALEFKKVEGDLQKKSNMADIKTAEANIKKLEMATNAVDVDIERADQLSKVLQARKNEIVARGGKGPGFGPNSDKKDPDLMLADIEKKQRIMRAVRNELPEESMPIEIGEFQAGGASADVMKKGLEVGGDVLKTGIKSTGETVQVVAPRVAEVPSKIISSVAQPASRIIGGIGRSAREGIREARQFGREKQLQEGRLSSIERQARAQQRFEQARAQRSQRANVELQKLKGEQTAEAEAREIRRPVEEFKTELELEELRRPPPPPEEFPEEEGEIDVDEQIFERAREEEEPQKSLAQRLGEKIIPPKIPTKLQTDEELQEFEESNIPEERMRRKRQAETEIRKRRLMGEEQRLTEEEFKGASLAERIGTQLETSQISLANKKVKNLELELERALARKNEGEVELISEELGEAKTKLGIAEDANRLFVGLVGPRARTKIMRTINTKEVSRDEIEDLFRALQQARNKEEKQQIMNRFLGPGMTFDEMDLSEDEIIESSGEDLPIPTVVDLPKKKFKQTPTIVDLPKKKFKPTPTIVDLPQELELEKPKRFASPLRPRTEEEIILERGEAFERRIEGLIEGVKLSSEGLPIDEETGRTIWSEIGDSGSKNWVNKKGRYFGKSIPGVGKFGETVAQIRNPDPDDQRFVSGMGNFIVKAGEGDVGVKFVYDKGQKSHIFKDNILALIASDHYENGEIEKIDEIARLDSEIEDDLSNYQEIFEEATKNNEFGQAMKNYIANQTNPETAQRLVSGENQRERLMRFLEKRSKILQGKRSSTSQEKPTQEVIKMMRKRRDN
jgi:hypothetical protein